MNKDEIDKLYRFYMLNYDKPTVSKYALMQFIYELYEELQKGAGEYIKGKISK